MSREVTEVPKKTFATWLGMTARNVDNLIDQGMPRVVHGVRVFIPWPEGLHWYLKFKAGDATPQGADKKKVDVRMAEVELELKELELARELEQVVTIDYMELQMSRILERLRAKLLNMPGRHAPHFVGIRSITESQLKWEDAVAEAMLTLTDTGEDPELDEEPATAA